MARDDWFRNQEWNDEIEAAFFAKLKRARNKSQYLRIQASTLAKRYPNVALQLLDSYFDLGEDFDYAQAYVDAATSFVALNKFHDAVSSYESALAREAEYPRLLTNAYLDMPYLIAVKEIEEKYSRALQVLEEHAKRVMFPIDAYKWNATKALIQASRSQHQEAKNFAREALNAAGATKSGFRNHPTIGLFSEEKVGKEVHARIMRLAN